MRKVDVLAFLVENTEPESFYDIVQQMKFSGEDIAGCNPAEASLAEARQYGVKRVVDVIALATAIDIARTTMRLK